MPCRLSILIAIAYIALLCQSPALAGVGGGYAAGGINGEYYNNTLLAGPPSFARRDVRIAFDWGVNLRPGGSDAPGYRDLGTTGYSVRWTGTLIPRFSERYTLRLTASDGARLFLRAAGESKWRTLLDAWQPRPITTAAASVALIAGQAYEVCVEHWQGEGPAEAKLAWSSPNTPEEPIEALSGLGINAETYKTSAFADAVQMARDEWRDPAFSEDRKLWPARDALGWPRADGAIIVWEGGATRHDGVYQLRFAGRAHVRLSFNYGRFSAGGKDYDADLPMGAGYDAAANTTSARLTVTDKGPENFILTFTETRRAPDSPPNSGVADVKLMRPVFPGAEAAYDPGSHFAGALTSALSRFSVLRWLGANFSAERDWQDRTPINGFCQLRSGTGRCAWEYLLCLANETGKDLYITIPETATGQAPTDRDSYVYKLAQLMRYGSDGVTPYAAPHKNPLWPPLNPNLKLYIEYSNEVWNYGFPAWRQNFDAAQAAVMQKTEEGRMLAFDGSADANILWDRRHALRLKQTADIFRAVWGEAEMPSGGADARIRPVLEWQYDNAGWPPVAETELAFLDRYFNNGDGMKHVTAPKPIRSYVWGGGGAIYFNAAMPAAATADAFFAGGIPTAGIGKTLLDYRHMLQAEANWAKLYGLRLVAYEGGWSVGKSEWMDGQSGGETAWSETVKYSDVRAKKALVDALTLFQAAGGDLVCVGTYGQWPDALGPRSAPDSMQIQAIEERAGTLPAEPDNGLTLPASLETSKATLARDAKGAALNPAGWFAWNVLSPRNAAYTYAVHITGSGGVVILADGVVCGTIAPGQQSGSGSLHLTKGLHVLRVTATEKPISLVSVSLNAAPL